MNSLIVCVCFLMAFSSVKAQYAFHNDPVSNFYSVAAPNSHTSFFRSLKPYQQLASPTPRFSYLNQPLSPFPFHQQLQHAAPAPYQALQAFSSAPAANSNLFESVLRNNANYIRPIPLAHKQFQPFEYPMGHQVPVRIQYSPSTEVSSARIVNPNHGLNVAF